MNWRRFATCSLSVAVSITTGCSLLVPSRQTLSIQTVQPQAKVWINGAYQGETPVQLSVVRNHNVILVVKKDGYETLNKLVECHLNNAGIFDTIGTYLFLLPLIGFVSPGSHSLDETAFNFQLAPEMKPASPTNAPAATAQ